MLFGLLLIVAGVMLPTANQHDTRTILRNIIIGLTTILLMCFPNKQSCVTDIANRAAIVMFTLGMISYVMWERYAANWLFSTFAVLISIAITIILLDVIIRIWDMIVKRRHITK